jgi:hypothetical protein
MDRYQKIYFIIHERKGATLQDLVQVTGWKQISVLRALIKLLYKRKVLSTDYLGTKFFVINPKVSKYG